MADAKKTQTKNITKKGTKKVNIYNLKGKVDKETTLPAVFDTSYRPDVIRRSVVAAQANRRQPYGPNVRAGQRHAASTWGKGRGVARVQRMTQGRRAVQSPNNVGGRRAHPPRPEEDRGKKINVKERRLGRASALAATTNKQLVAARGHKFNAKFTLPLVVNDNFEKIQRTKKMIDLFNSLELDRELDRAKNGRHVRAGRGKLRGRRYKTPKSVLVIVSDDSTCGPALNNILGVDVATPESLNTELLAPGGDPGRLVIITQGALEKMGGW